MKWNDSSAYEFQSAVFLLWAELVFAAVNFLHSHLSSLYLRWLQSDFSQCSSTATVGSASCEISQELPLKQIGWTGQSLRHRTHQDAVCIWNWCFPKLRPNQPQARAVQPMPMPSLDTKEPLGGELGVGGQNDIKCFADELWYWHSTNVV